MKGMIMAKAGTLVGQHAHKYAHTSLLVRGSVRVFLNGLRDCVDYKAPAFIHIPPEIKHEFLSLENDTHVYCIHNVSQTGTVEIHAHAQLAEVA